MSPLRILAAAVGVTFPHVEVISDAFELTVLAHLSVTPDGLAAYGVGATSSPGCYASWPERAKTLTLGKATFAWWGRA